METETHPEEDQAQENSQEDNQELEEAMEGNRVVNFQEPEQQPEDTNFSYKEVSEISDITEEVFPDGL